MPIDMFATAQKIRVSTVMLGAPITVSSLALCLTEPGRTRS